jgi:hypothetical protein
MKEENAGPVGYHPKGCTIKERALTSPSRYKECQVFSPNKERVLASCVG